MLSEDLESKFLRLATGHQQDTRNTVGDLTRVSTRSRPVPPLRERRTNLSKRLLRRTRSDPVVLGDEDFLALGLRVGRSGRRGGSDESLDGEDLLVKEAGGLRLGGALLRGGGELVHPFAGDVEVCALGRVST